MTGQKARDERKRSWLDIPGVAGLVGGAAFMAVMIGGFILGSLLIHGEVHW